MIEPPSVHSAREDLIYIRRTLEAAGQFTAVPGKCLIAAGLMALAGVAFNAAYTGAPWIAGPRQVQALETWGIVLGISLAIVSYGIYRKTRQTRTTIQAPLVRKLLWSLCPALFVGAILTDLAVRTYNLDWLPTIWLGCYGAAVTNGGQVSVAPVRYMGVSFLVVAAGAALSPHGMGLTWLAIGFGWLHLVFGAYIAWRHNG
ncbi:MAG TPA: hypothetical protein VE398_01490 [Acidobacteriota bacterium]|nr:hypothetical protein [Acidobacteriota bacterium]